MPDIVRTAAEMLAGRLGRETRLDAPEYLKRIVNARDLLPPSKANRPMQPEWSLEGAIDNGLKVDALVYSAFRSRAQAVGSVPWTADVRSSDGTWEPAEDHPIVELIENPNPTQSRQEAHEVLTYHLDLGGNSLRQKIMLTRRESRALAPAVSEIWTLVPDGFSPVPTRDGGATLSHYLYERDGVKKRFEVEEIIHTVYPDPGNPFWGLSPLVAMARVVDTGIAAVEWNLDSMSNRAIADGVFSAKEMLTERDYKRYRKMIREQQSGGEPHAPWLLGGGLSYQAMSRTPVEMDFVSSLEFWREMILSGADVPPVIAGFFDQATLANAQTSRRLFWVDKLVPFLSRIAAVYSRALVPHFDDPRNLRVRADLSGIEALQESRAEQSEVFARLIGSGVPYNEAAEVSGLPLSPIDGAGDEPFGVSVQEAEAAIEERLGRPPRPVSVTFKRNGEPASPRETKLSAVAAQPPLRDVLDRLEREVRRLFLDAAEAARSAVSSPAVRLALETGGATELAAALGLSDLATALDDVLPGKLASIVDRGVALGTRDLISKSKLGRDAVEELVASLVVDHGRSAIGSELVASNERGLLWALEKYRAGELGEADAVAKVLGETVGLDANRTKKVVSFFRTTSAGGRIGDALEKTRKLAEGALRERAAAIAGQEATAALHLGFEEPWRLAQRRGVVNAVKTWVDGMDSLVCEICLDLSGQTVPVDEDYFSNVLGTNVKASAGHFGCRCGEIITVRDF